MDFSCDHEITQCSAILFKSCIYGSISIDEEREEFHMIEPSSLVFSTSFAQRGGNLRACQLSHLTKSTIPTIPVLRITSDRRTRHFLKQKKPRGAVVEWCRENLGIALSIGGQQSRGPTPGISKYLAAYYATNSWQERWKLYGSRGHQCH